MHSNKRAITPWEIIRVICAKGYLRWLPDDLYLRLMYHARHHKKLHLDNPVAYTEKIQWLKLYDRNPLYTSLVDKYKVREYVTEKIGNEYLIPLLGVWDSPDEIDFDKLPNHFVLKCNHDSGTVIICKDKALLDKEKTKEYLREKMKKDYYIRGREWPYKNVERKIIAESYMEDDKTGELRDYKFFCFDGIVKLLYVATNRQNKDSETCFDFFDMNFQHLNVRNDHPNAKQIPEKPESFELMISLAEKLGQGFPHVRVDFYEVNGKPYFGEMTFSHMCGMAPFEPYDIDVKMGEWLQLPKKKNKSYTSTTSLS